MSTSGVADGPFIKFEGWDVPGNDVAYYPGLKGNVDALKDIILKKHGSLFYAFNTDGYMKSWTVLDWSKFRQKAGHTLYVRVQYPGWHFVQGQDSVGNDIQKIKDVSTAPAILSKIDEIWEDDESNERIAAVNTQGWAKSKVTFPLTVGPGPGAPTSLDGIYIRTDFRSFKFFPQIDSPGGDITRDAGAANDVPALIRATLSKDNGAGFNTNGWIKSQLTVCPTATAGSLTAPWQGLYVRVRWPDFVYLPGLDSPGNDRHRHTSTQLPDLIRAAREDPTVVAFNTDGWLKTDLNDTPSHLGDDQKTLGGLYVKIIPGSSSVEAAAVRGGCTTHTALKVALFALSGTAILWGKRFIADATVRKTYSGGVAAKCASIIADVKAGVLTAEVAVQHAVEMRNTWLESIQRKTSHLKAEAGTYQQYLDQYANERYNKKFMHLTPEEAAVVGIQVAGRSNPKVTALMNGLGKVGKSSMVVSTVISVSSVTVAEEWKYELGKQVSSWSGAISAGHIGAAGRGRIFGPVGAVVGGIAGGIIGGLAGESIDSDLASWFFGGTSRQCGKDLLRPVLEVMSGYVQEHIKLSGKKFHVHQVLASHMSALRADASQAAEIARQMMLTLSIERREAEVVATIVWIVTEDGIFPTNASNPADLILLMNWTVTNRPRWERLDANRDTAKIAAGQHSIYQLHHGGQIWRFNGSTWDSIDNNSETIEIAAGGRDIYQRHKDGEIWQYQGEKWACLDRNGNTVQIAAGGDQLYQLHNGGSIWQYTGGSWICISPDGDTASILASNDGTLYQLQRNGQILVYADSKWVSLDNNRDTVEITASNGHVYQRHRDGHIYRYTGCGWEQIDSNGDTLGIVAGGDHLFQRHQNQIYRYLGTPYSWEVVDTTCSTIEAIVTDGDTLYQRHDEGSVWRFFF